MADLGIVTTAAVQPPLVASIVVVKFKCIKPNIGFESTYSYNCSVVISMCNKTGSCSTSKVS